MGRSFTAFARLVKSWQLVKALGQASWHGLPLAAMKNGKEAWLELSCLASVKLFFYGVQVRELCRYFFL